MKRTILEMLIDSLGGCILLFGITVLFSGAAFRSPVELLAAFGACWLTVLLVETGVRLSHMTNDPEGAEAHARREH